MSTFQDELLRLMDRFESKLHELMRCQGLDQPDMRGQLTFQLEKGEPGSYRPEHRHTLSRTISFGTGRYKTTKALGKDDWQAIFELNWPEGLQKVLHELMVTANRPMAYERFLELLDIEFREWFAFSNDELSEFNAALREAELPYRMGRYDPLKRFPGGPKYPRVKIYIVE